MPPHHERNGFQSQHNSLAFVLLFALGVAMELTSMQGRETGQDSEPVMRLVEISAGYWLPRALPCSGRSRGCRRTR